MSRDTINESGTIAEELFREYRARLYTMLRLSPSLGWAGEDQIRSAIGLAAVDVQKGIEEGKLSANNLPLKLLYRIASRRVHDSGRSEDKRRQRGENKRRLVTGEDDLLEKLPSRELDPFDEAVRREFWEAATDVLGSAMSSGAQWAKVGWMKYVDGLEDREIANELGLSPNTMSGHIKRVKDELRFRLPKFRDVLD